MELALASLLHEIRHCTLCAAHLPHTPRPVLQCHSQARIVIAGQAPGRKVHETGIPFHDASGQRLRRWLGISSEVFYDAERIAILPMGFCYPGTGASGDLPPRPECAATWRSSLLTQLPNVRLTIVIGHYAQAYYMLKTNDSVTDTVRSWRRYLPAMIPLPHPSPRNTLWLRCNPWFEDEVIPALQKHVQNALTVGER